MPYKDKNKQREYARNWIAKRRTDFFKDKICINCGSTDNLELHHRNPIDKISHRIWSWKEEKRLEEIEKCDVLCKQCHSLITKSQKIIGEHGHKGMYNRGCRCTECKKANTLSHRK